jgi:predicted GH43/DUF377 family glycosyl hydrolase
LLSVIPMLHHEYMTTGAKPTLVVSKAYRQIPESLGCLTPLVYDGDMQDLEGAIKFAKSRCDDVRVTQMHGRGFTFQHRHPSYQYDQWERAGYLDKWDTLPLVLPRTKEPLRFLEKHMVSWPFILYGDHSQSSPFWHKEQLAEALKENFPQHSIVRLSSIRAPHALELLALMEAADLIVSVDSMQLHMAKATTTPLIALVSDQPTRWQGSAWSKRFALHCRYSDFPRRRDEIVRVAKDCIEGKPQLTATPIDGNKNAYNPSIIQFGDKLLTVSRYHPKRAWPTRLAISDGQTTSDILFPAELDGLSFEDARLFHHQGKLMICYVLAKSLPVSNQFRCVMGYGMLVQREGRWHVEKHIQPKFRNNDWSGMVKNWTPFEHDGKIHFIWGNAFNEQVIIQVDGDKVVEEIKSPEPKWDYGEIRGGAIVRHRDKLLRFFHSRTGAVGWGAHGTFQYHVGAALMEAMPPFKTVAVSKWPILSGDERYVPGVFHWKPNCALVFGAVVKGDKILISCGRNDCLSELVELIESDLALT